MARNPAGFKITNTANGWNKADFDDVFINKRCFEEGNLWSWGFNDDGRTGNNRIINYSSPVQEITLGTNWRKATTFGGGSAGIKSDGTLWLFGENGSGELGTNNLIFRSSPVQTISGGTNWKDASKGYAFIATIKSDGTLWTWGSNAVGQLGNNLITNTSSPIQTISGGTNWKSVSAGETFAAAIKTDGTLWLWGQNNLGGNLGDNSIVNKSSPVQTIAQGNNWKQVSTGCIHVGAIKTDGSLWVWGGNGAGLDGGLLGDNTAISRSSPVQTVSGGTNWKQVSIGRCHSAAIKTDGTLWTWGSNSSFRLGNLTTTLHRSSPVQTISGGTNWREVSLGVTSSTAIKTDGTLWTWGGNVNGQLGNNATGTNICVPAQTVMTDTLWTTASTGTGFVIGIKQN